MKTIRSALMRSVSFAFAIGLSACGNASYDKSVECGIEYSPVDGPSLVCKGMIVEKADKEPTEPATGQVRVNTVLKLDTQQQAVLNIVAEVAVANDIDPVDFATVAKIESNLRASARNPNSTAKGVFQFLASTAKAYKLGEPYDARKNAVAAASLWQDNAAFLTKHLGRKPLGHEIYLAHQQGAGGAMKLLTSLSKATDVVGRAAIELNTLSGQTKSGGNISSQAFVDMWEEKFLKVRAQFYLQ